MRLIDADALAENWFYTNDTGAKVVELCEIETAPTVDAEPVKHGRWIMREDYCDDEYWECSACKEHFYFSAGTPESNGYSFCPNCGAKMESGVKEYMNER